jgi:hypothetical protein
MTQKQLGLLGAGPALPEGFKYQPDLISPDDERALLERVRELPFKEFEFHFFVGNRWGSPTAGATISASDLFWGLIFHLSTPPNAFRWLLNHFRSLLGHFCLLPNHFCLLPNRFCLLPNHFRSLLRHF